jgi:hypothetical protein
MPASEMLKVLLDIRLTESCVQHGLVGLRSNPIEFKPGSFEIQLLPDCVFNELTDRAAIGAKLFKVSNQLIW